MAIWTDFWVSNVFLSLIGYQWRLKKCAFISGSLITLCLTVCCVIAESEETLGDCNTGILLDVVLLAIFLMTLALALALSMSSCMIIGDRFFIDACRLVL